MTPSAPLLRFRALRKTIGAGRILLDIGEFAIAAGSCTMLTGPNGAGKTTLLKIVATLLRPSGGRVRLFGSELEPADVRRRVGFLSHESFVYADLTPRENLRFYARAFGLAAPEKRIAALIARVGLSGWEDVPVRCFSRGMEQRIALARAFLHEPDLLLLDEPYSGLDAQAVVLLSGLLAEARAAGKAIILTTHDIALGLSACSRALILSRGRVAREWTDAVPSVEEFLDVYGGVVEQRRPRPLSAAAAGGG